MECSSVVYGNIVVPLNVMAETATVKSVGIVLFEGFALPEAAAIAEVFQSVNALTESAHRNRVRYEVSLLSAAGGRIESSSSVFVWTEDIEARRHTKGFNVLFIAGGSGVSNALRDERLINWLRRAQSRSDTMVPIGDGRLLLDVAGSGHGTGILRYGDGAVNLIRNGSPSNAASVAANPLQSALTVVEEDFGADVARQVSDCVAPSADTRFTTIVRKNASGSVSDKIKASAKWLEENGHRAISIDAAAQVAVMSERNFLRRFKIEMGVTPSDYLLYVRLDMSCRLLIETDLPVDKVARRCGIGCGGRLAKLFRKHLSTTPTEYRLSKRP
jgi:transcriptional regulator GlxA family with amidase domain